MHVTDAETNLHDYRGGVIEDTTGQRNIDHIVSIVGWGEDETGKKFWIGRNSCEWAELGYTRHGCEVSSQPLQAAEFEREKTTANSRAGMCVCVLCGMLPHSLRVWTCASLGGGKNVGRTTVEHARARQRRLAERATAVLIRVAQGLV